MDHKSPPLLLPSMSPEPKAGLFRNSRASELHLQIDIMNQDHPASASWTEPRAPVISLAFHRVI